MVAQVKAWGNSQGIRLSKELLALEGIELIEGGIVLKKTKKEHRTLEERAKEFGGQLGPYEEFDWGDPEGRERW